MQSLLNDLIDTSTVFVGEIASRKYVCKLQDDGDFLLLSEDKVIPGKRKKGIKPKIKNIKPCQYYHERLKDKAPKIELLALEEILNNEDYVETHDVNTLYLKEIAGVCRYVDVASNKGLFKRIVQNGTIIYIPINHNYSASEYNLEKELKIIDIIDQEKLTSSMTIDNLNQVIREYILERRIKKEEERKNKEETSKKNFLKTLFKR